MASEELKIGSATIGGSLGSSPGLLVGSIFYDKHSIVPDPWETDFDQEQAAILIDRVNQLSATYGLSMAFDVLAAAEEPMEAYLRFVAERTELPLLLNATEADVRVAALEVAADLGLLERSVYASLNEDTEDHELDTLRRHRPAGVMILATNVMDPTPDGTCQMIEDHFAPMLDDIGCPVPIVDVGTMDPPSIGLNLRSVEMVRQRYGYPVGCAFANAFPQWTGLREQGRDKLDLSLAAAMVACRMAGADFLHYGIIEKAAPMAHAAGTLELFLGFAAQELDGHRMDPGHPLYRMFKLGAPGSVG